MVKGTSKSEVFDGRGKGVNILVEVEPERELYEGTGEEIYWTIEAITKGEVGERRREMHNRYIKGGSKSEMCKILWETVNILIKVHPKSKVGDRFRE